MENRFKSIYDKLADERSRYVFEKRLMYSLTGDKEYVLTLGREYEAAALDSAEWKDFYAKLESAKENIALYAAGYWGRELLAHTPDIPWKYVIDKNPAAADFCGVPLMSPEEYIAAGEDCSIVITSRVYFEEIRDELIEKGIPADKIIDGALLFDMSEGRQYFELDRLPHSAGREVFADVGCYDGLSAFYFDRWCEGKGFSYCFEPDRKNIERIHRVLKNKGITSYELIDKGVWSKSGSLSFVSTGNSVSHVSNDGDLADAGADKIDVAALDEVLYDKQVTFIKMDIEGAEYEALLGAKQLISRQHPKLAICVYHKPEDIWEIPELILSYYPDYRFYLRHYSYKDNETVLYAF